MLRRHLRRWEGVIPLAALVLCCASCNGSRDRFLADLQSPRPEERAAAVKKLAAIAKTEDLVLFTQAAKDPAAIVRREAASVLGKSQDPRVVDLLGELLGDADEEVQARAAMALAEVRNDKAKAYLTSQYGRRGQATRQVIVQALKAANVPGAMASVIAAEAKSLWERNLEALTEGSLPERVGAAEELGKSGRAEAVNRLVPLLRDTQVVLAAAAVRGLGHAGDRRATAPIAGLLSENFPDLRLAATEALLRLGDPAALAGLYAVAIEHSSASPAATAALIALPRSPETDKALCDVTLNAAPAEAVGAGREMRNRGGCPLDPILAKLRQTSTAPAALQAIQGLGPGARDVLPKVMALLSNSDGALRRLAVDAVAEIGDPSTAPAIQKIFEQEVKTVGALRTDWIAGAPGIDGGMPAGGRPGASQFSELMRKVEQRDRTRVAEAGKELVEPRPPAELVDDASDDQVALLASALRALGRLRAEGAFELIQPFAEDGSPRLRAAANVGLAHLGPAGIAIARRGLIDPDRDVQAATAAALAEQGEAGQAEILAILPRRVGDKTRLLEPLVRSGVTRSAVQPLLAILPEGGVEVGLAAQLLGELRAKEAVDPLMRLLEDRTALARREVLLALGKLGDPKAAEVIARDLYHDSPDVRAAAAEALATIGGPAQLEPLDALKGDYYRKVRESAEAALQRLAPAQPEAHK